jgi:hypothetical protein
MDAGTVTATVGAVVVAVVGIVYTLVRLLGQRQIPSGNNGNGQLSITKAIEALGEHIKEQTAIMRCINERQIGQGYEQAKMTDAVVRLEQSQVAMHRRFDQAIKGPVSE